LNNYDILLFNEIWQVKDHEVLTLNNFKLVNLVQRDGRKGGGVAIFVRENIIVEKLDSPFITGIIETASIKINNTIFCSLYRPPSGNKQSFSDNLNDWITTLNNRDLYIAGDFNLNIYNTDKAYFDTIEANTGLKPCISDVTRVATGSCIDNILTTVQGKHLVTKISIADHLGLRSNLKIKIKKEQPKAFTYRSMKESNWNTFHQKISIISIRGSNLNSKWSNLLYDIKQSITTSFPEKESKIKYTFSMSQGLLKSKHKKNKLLRQFKRGEIEKEVYLRYNRIYRQLIIKEKEKSFIQRMEESGKDSKKNGMYLKPSLN